MIDEEYVQSKWTGDCTAGNESYLGVFFNYKWNVSLNRDLFVFPQFETEEEAWTAAAEFTRQREEEIRKVDEEIALIRGLVILLRSEPGDLTTPIWQRVLVNEHAKLAELKRGMK